MDEQIDEGSYHLGWLEPPHIHGIVKHVFDHCKLFSNSDWMAREDHLKSYKSKLSAIHHFGLERLQRSGICCQKVPESIPFSV
jgi:hypothetical protein